MKFLLLLFITLFYFIISPNISIAIEYLEQNAKSSGKGECGKYVGNALIKAGFNIRNYNRHAYLFYYDNLLINAGFKIIGNGTNIPIFLPGDIMVNLNTTKHKYGHICMYNGTKWISDFVQNTIHTYKDELDIPTYFFRYIEKTNEVDISKKCGCYNYFLIDEKYQNDECFIIIFDFLYKEICPLFPDNNVTKEEIDKCEMNYFCGTKEENNESQSQSHYISLPIFIVLNLFLIYF